jgi:hypothetical protein
LWRSADIERRNRIAEACREWREKTADAGVHVQPEVASLREHGEFADRIDDAVRERRRRSDQHDRVRRDCIGHGGNIGAIVVGKRDPVHGYTQIVRSLVERRMRADRDDDVGCDDLRPLGSRPVAGGFHRQEDALGATGGHHARRILGRMQQIGGPSDDIVLELLETRKRLRTERILGEESLIRFLRDGEHVVARVMHVEAETSALPVDVIAPRRLHLGEKI